MADEEGLQDSRPVADEEGLHYAQRQQKTPLAANIGLRGAFSYTVSICYSDRSIKQVTHEHAREQAA